jgi:hypothetical protein
MIFPSFARRILNKKEYVIEITKMKNITTPVSPDILLTMDMSTSDNHSWVGQGMGGENKEKGSFIGMERVSSINSPALM